MAKVIFLHLSVILFTGGGMSETEPPRSRHPPRADTPWVRHPTRADTPPEQTPPEQTTPGADTPPCQTPPKSRHPPGADTPLGQTPLPAADSSIRSTSGRYASYWNAFLFVVFLVGSSTQQEILFRM